MILAAGSAERCVARRGDIPSHQHPPVTSGCDAPARAPMRLLLLTSRGNKNNAALERSCRENGTRQSDTVASPRAAGGLAAKQLHNLSGARRVGSSSCSPVGAAGMGSLLQLLLPAAAQGLHSQQSLMEAAGGLQQSQQSHHGRALLLAEVSVHSSPGSVALYAIIVVLLVLGAGCMSGLTLGLLSLDVLDLEVRRQLHTPATRRGLSSAAAALTAMVAAVLAQPPFVAHTNAGASPGAAHKRPAKAATCCGAPHPARCAAALAAVHAAAVQCSLHGGPAALPGPPAQPAGSHFT